jgi:hypothetical protein
MLTTIGWQRQQQTTYLLEGSVFMGGAIVQWLRDGLGLISRSDEIEPLAASVPDSDGVYLVPAHTGLGAPYWDPYARGALLGMTRGTNRAHVARAALEAIAFRVPRFWAQWNGMPAVACANCGSMAVRRQQSAAAVPGRSARRAGGPSADHRDHRPRRRLPGGAGGRLLA